MDTDSLISLLDIVFCTRSPLVMKHTLETLRRLAYEGRGADAISSALKAIDKLEKHPNDPERLIEVLLKLASVFYPQLQVTVSPPIVIAALGWRTRATGTGTLVQE